MEEQHNHLVEACSGFVTALSQREYLIFGEQYNDINALIGKSLSDDQKKTLSDEFWSQPQIIDEITEALKKDFEQLSILDDPHEGNLDAKFTIPEAAARARAHLEGERSSSAAGFDAISIGSAALLFSSAIFVLAAAYALIRISRAATGDKNGAFLTANLKVEAPLTKFETAINFKSAPVIADIKSVVLEGKAE